MSSETNVYTINKKNMKNIYEKLYNACNHASGVKKASKVKGMPFNPLLHDDVQRVAMAALLENRYMRLVTMLQMLHLNV